MPPLGKLTGTVQHACKRISDSAGIRSLADRLKRELEVSEGIDVELECTLIDEARKAKDLDLLKVFAHYPTVHLWPGKLTYKGIVQSLRSAGHQEAFPLLREKTTMDRAVKISGAISIALADHEMDMFFQLKRKECDAIFDAVRNACILGPDDVSSYLLHDTDRALTLASDRRAMSHKDLISIVEGFLTSPARRNSPAACCKRN